MSNLPISNQTVGRVGENVAVQFLVQQGYRIVARNVRTARSEIDIICHPPVGDEWWFVEVKARRSHQFGLPEDAITRTKLAHMAAAALLYLEQQGLAEADPPTVWRLAVVAIDLTPSLGVQAIRMIDDLWL